MKQYNIINGNNLEVLLTLEENSVDAIITDPPYELGFMGKKWDASGIAYNVELWKRALRVLKPGGYLLAFGGSRTFHRIACAIEDAGFEIRDTIMWLYGSGFPKSMNIGLAIDKKNGVESEETKNEWDGWGTALKPAYEPIVMARKPFKCSLVDNILEYGVGGINIDECRVGNEEHSVNINDFSNQHGNKWGNGEAIPKLGEKTVNGRFPANLIHDGSEEATKGMPVGGKNGTTSKPYEATNKVYGKYTCFTPFESYNDSGSASRYFYCAKASKKDRDEGLDSFESKTTGELQGGRKEGSAGSIMKNADGSTRVNPYAGTGAPKKNIHPTVKPTELMQYLVRLVCPKGATI